MLATKSHETRIVVILAVIFLVMLLSVPLAGQDVRTVPLKDTARDSLLSTVPPELRPVCHPNQPYKPVEPPDEIARLLSERKRYRLVIGAGEFRDEKKFNQEYVGKTAKLVDERLDAMGYAPLPSLENKPYLIGPDANKGAIKNAIEKMADKGMGIIYYIGHGTVADDHKDLSLAVWDSPVKAGEGISFNGLISTLELHKHPSDVREIPQFVVVLEACYSGNVDVWTDIVLENKKGVQTINAIPPAIVVPDQISILTATAEGDNARATNLKDTDLSAFGYYFTRALDVDWDCADEETPDGILTLLELKHYLEERLMLARAAGAISEMHPKIKPRSDGELTFIAYSPDRVSTFPGARKALKTLLTQRPGQEHVELMMPSGLKHFCSSSRQDGCSILFSKNTTGILTLEVSSFHSQIDFGAFWSSVLDFIRKSLDKTFGRSNEDKKRTTVPADLSNSNSRGSGPAQPKIKTTTKRGTIELSKLVRQRRAKVAGVWLEVK